MTCHKLCEPCDCPPAPEPVLPRCDIALPDGVFTNATVVVDDGCIVKVEKGRPSQYAPDDCCDGGGNAVILPPEPCDCPPGEPGRNATISIGKVQSIAPGAPPRVENSGTESNAVLDFYIPRGEQGQDAEAGSGAESDAGGIAIEDGRIIALPAAWPPVLAVASSTDNPDVSFTFSAPDPETGLAEAEVRVGPMLSTLRQWVSLQIEQATQPLHDQLASQQNQINELKAQIKECCDKP